MNFIKKNVLILAGSLLLFTGCSSSNSAELEHTSQSSEDEFTQKYILTAFYGNDDQRNSFIQEKKNDGVLHNITYDESSGYITITASLTQAQYWVREAENDIEQNALKVKSNDNYSISVNASDTELTVTASPSWNLNHLNKILSRDLMDMEIHQVFSGISSWHIDVNIVNSDTTEKARTFSLPDEPLKLDNSIWSLKNS